MKNYITILLALLLACASGNAYDFKIDGICYADIGDGSVAVTRDSVATARYKGNITVPDMVTFNGNKYVVRGIGANAFAGSYDLQRITLPDSIKVIEDYAFSGCINLAEITIPVDVVYIGKGVLQQCNLLKTMNYNARNVEYLGSFCEQAGYEWLRINSLNIGRNVEVLPKGFVSGAANLRHIYIPASVRKIEPEPFLGCKQLHEIEADSSNDNYSSCNGVLYNKDRTTITAYPNMHASAFTIPEGVKSIEAGCFAKCANLHVVTLPRTLENIGENAFWYCKNLSSIAVPGNVSSIGLLAFGACPAMNSLTVDKHNKVYSSYKNVIFNKNKTEIITVMASLAGVYVMPKTVTKISNLAFAFCYKVDSITFSNRLTEVGNSSFRSCNGLKLIELPQGVQTIGAEAFANAAHLESIKMPNSVTKIGEWCFSGCTQLKRITLPESLDTISRYTFYNCKSLNEIKLDNKLKAISEGAFTGCNSLTDIVVPNSVTTIGEGAFYRCNQLNSITIGCKVDQIAKFAFAGCRNISTITALPTIPPACGENAFIEVPATATLRVAAAAATKYRQAPQWNKFKIDTQENK